MAADRISISPDKLRSDAGKMRQYKSEYDATIKSLATLVNGIDSCWVGDAQVAFAEEYRRMVSSFDKFSKLLEDYAVELTNSANEMEEEDRKLGNKVNNDNSVNGL